MPLSHRTFQLLTFEQQVQWVWDEGRYNATRYEEEDTVGLYHMTGGFFVELYYNDIENRIVERTTSFTQREYLEDYACYVKLDELNL